MDAPSGSALEEQLREDKQESKTGAHRKQAEHAKIIRGVVHENKGTSHVQDEMREVMHHDEQELLSLWKG